MLRAAAEGFRAWRRGFPSQFIILSRLKRFLREGSKAVGAEGPNGVERFRAQGFKKSGGLRP